MKIPEVGLVVCNSAASNSGTVAGLAAMQVVKMFQGKVGICSLPALVNRVPRQLATVKALKHIIVVDGCHQECAKHIIEGLGVKYDAYVNLEYDLGMKKLGPFTTLQHSEDDVKRTAELIAKVVREVL